MLLVAWRGGLTVCVRAVTAINHGLALEGRKTLLQLMGDVDSNAKTQHGSIIYCSAVLGVAQKNYRLNSYISILLGESVDRW